MTLVMLSEYTCADHVVVCLGLSCVIKFAVLPVRLFVVALFMFTEVKGFLRQSSIFSGIEPFPPSFFLHAFSPRDIDQLDHFIDQIIVTPSHFFFFLFVS